MKSLIHVFCSMLAINLMMASSVSFAQTELAYPTSVLEGNDRGNGTDFKNNYHGVAWFGQAERTINWCYEVSPSFGISPQEAEGEIRSALKTWKTYLVTKKIVPSLPLSTSFQMLPECSASADLRFYLGTKPSNVSDFDPGSSLAVPVRQSYDPRRAWGQGFIWVTETGSMDASNAGLYGVAPNITFPNWSESYTLRGVLLHELGHVYGIEEHVADTIMDADLFAHLTNESDSYRKQRLSQIDYNKELYICEECELSKSGHLGQLPDYFEYQSGQRLRINENVNYQFLTGREPTASFQSFVKGSAQSGYQLVIESERVHEAYPIDLLSASSTTKFHSDFIFSYVRIGHSMVKSHLIMSQHGILTTPTGRHHVIIHRNHASEPFIDFEIQVINGDDVRTLFISDTPYIGHMIQLRNADSNH